MAHSQETAELADRIRDHLVGTPYTEKRMFGSAAFLIGGHLAVAASGQGGLMVRCDRGETEGLVAEPGASRMVMKGRELDGWLRVTDDAVAGEAELARWVEVGTSYAGGLPPK